MARGTPKKPAPVSGPGAMSRRTDGGPGNKAQPLRVATGQPHGEAQASEEQQKAAPLAGSTSPRPVGGPATSTPPTGGVFGPTNRPGEHPLTGAGPMPGAQPPDADALLRAIYRQYPHPQLLKLIRAR